MKKVGVFMKLGVEILVIERRGGERVRRRLEDEEEVVVGSVVGVGMVW